MHTQQSAQRPWSLSLKEYARSIAGGLLFSLPMLYTMEVWWTGFIVNPLSLIIYMVFIFLLLLGYNRFAGMRKDATYKEVIVDSVEELGLGLLISFLFLWMINRINPGTMHHLEIAGMVIIEAMAVAIGISVGTAQLGASEENDSGVEGKRVNRGILSHAVTGMCGAMLVGSNLAPTDEITMIGTEISFMQSLLLLLVSLILIALIMFYIGFTNTSEISGNDFIIRVIKGTVLAYSVAFMISVFVMWFFGHYEGNDLSVCVNITIVMTVATSLGSSAGHLLLKGDDE